MQQLPIIDYEDITSANGAASKEVAKAIDAACRGVGFFYLRNAPLLKEQAAAFAAAQEFFAQPEQEKQKISIENSPCHRGWFALGGENLDGSKTGDYKEGIKIGRNLPATHPRVMAGVPLHGANQYPALNGWQEIMEDYYTACERVCRQLMRGISCALALPPTHFDQWLVEPMATLAPLYYPPLPQDKQILSAGAHTDFGCLTLLAQHELDGLEIWSDNSWQKVPIIDDCLVVNIGDMLAFWTGGRYQSTRHRVINHHAKARYSLAYFFDPDPDADLSPLFPNDTETTSPKTCLQYLLARIEDSFAYRQNEINQND